MSRFQESLEEGYVRIIPIDKPKARSLIKASEQALYAANKLPLEPLTLKSILRELYEALRQMAEAIGYLQGYKFSSHESVVYFISDVLHDEKLSAKFDRYRKMRNGVNYYGDDVSEETVKEALVKIPELVALLRQMIKLD